MKNHTHNNAKHTNKNNKINITTEKIYGLKQSKESGDNKANGEGNTYPCAHCVNKCLLQHSFLQLCLARDRTICMLTFMFAL